MQEWDELEFFSCPEWAEIQEKLDALDQQGIVYNPDRSDLFAALDLCPFKDCKVAIFGQDPYPQHKFATGSAFSIPVSETKWPRTLVTLITEYCKDLSYPTPKTGNLQKWQDQGVLLWNVIPTCLEGQSLSHYDWKWNWLTKEIIEVLNKKEQGCVMVFCGAIAREFEHYADHQSCHVIATSHPSPRSSLVGAQKYYRVWPFKGSRIFSTINDRLVDLKYSPIDWRLP